MEPLELTAYRLLKESQAPLPRINDILHGKYSTSADTGVRLGIHFGLPAQFWLNLQNDCDLRLAKSPAFEKIKARIAA